MWWCLALCHANLRSDPAHISTDHNAWKFGQHSRSLIKMKLHPYDKDSTSIFSRHDTYVDWTWMDMRDPNILLDDDL